MITEELKRALEIQAELYEMAASYYLDKTDFNPGDWLDDENLEKLQEADRIIEESENKQLEKT